MKRSSKKIDAPRFLTILCLNSQIGSPSYNDLASSFHATYDTLASKQAFWKKVNSSCLIFFQKVLARIIQMKVGEMETREHETFKQFKRVIIQDSTIIKLPLHLFKVFSGVSNAHSSVCNARIQGVYDLISGHFISFSIDPYSKNDQVAASELELQKGDLVLRDRGYSTMKEIKRHTTEEAFCIYRYKLNSTYIDPSSGKPFDLKAALIKDNSIDMEVCLADKERTRVRLLAAPVNQELADLRRMKAKKEMRGHNPSAELLFLMSWTIFVTNIPIAQSSYNQILATYRLRWRIESIFKIWKSYMSFDQIHNVSENQLKVLLTARFLMVVTTIHLAYQPCYLKIRCIYNKHISMMKTVKYFMTNPNMLCEIVYLINICPEKLKLRLAVLLKYCSYDKRKRLNFYQLTEMAFLS